MGLIKNLVTTGEYAYKGVQVVVGAILLLMMTFVLAMCLFATCVVL